jgi:hypothetical protein
MARAVLTDGMYSYSLEKGGELSIFVSNNEAFLPLCKLAHTHTALSGVNDKKVFQQARDATTYALRKEAKNGKFKKFVMPGFELRMPVVAVSLRDAGIVLDVLARKDKQAVAVIRSAVQSILQDEYWSLRKGLQTTVVKAAVMYGLCSGKRERGGQEEVEGRGLRFPLDPGRYSLQLSFAAVEFAVTDEHVLICAKHMLGALECATGGRTKAYLRRERRKKTAKATVMHAFGAEGASKRLVAGWTLGYTSELLASMWHYMRANKAGLDKTQIEEVRVALDRLLAKERSILLQVERKGDHAAAFCGTSNAGTDAASTRDDTKKREDESTGGEATGIGRAVEEMDIGGATESAAPSTEWGLKFPLANGRYTMQLTFNDLVLTFVVHGENVLMLSTEMLDAFDWALEARTDRFMCGEKKQRLRATTDYPFGTKKTPKRMLPGWTLEYAFELTSRMCEYALKDRPALDSTLIEEVRDKLGMLLARNDRVLPVLEHKGAE